MKSEVEELAKSLGADLVGISPVGRFKDLPETYRPRYLLPEARSVISVGVAMDIKPDPKPLEANERLLRSGKAKEEEYEAIGKLLKIVDHILFFLSDRGHKGRECYPDRPFHEDKLKGFFPLKYAAEKAGLGRTGKNHLLITEEYGPRVRLASVITSAEFDQYDTPIQKDFCENCNLCVKACPTEALSYGVDLYQDKREEHIRKVKNLCWRECLKNDEKYGIDACEVCMIVCPQGSRP